MGRGRELPQMACFEGERIGRDENMVQDDRVPVIEENPELRPASRVNECKEDRERERPFSGFIEFICASQRHY